MKRTWTTITRTPGPNPDPNPTARRNQMHESVTWRFAARPKGFEPLTF